MSDPISNPILNVIPGVFAAQKAAAVARRLNFGLAERRAALARLGEAIHRHEGALLSALAADLGKSAPEAVLTEILPLLQEIRHARRNLRRWMRPRRIAPGLAGLGTSARVVPQPRRTCLILAPWNYPVNLCLGPLVSCLAAGNSAILKPSELAPATSAALAQLVAEVFPPELVAVVEGGAAQAEALLDLPFDHVFFTGSPAVGRKVMAAAARHLASVTLELGGKSPAILGPGADMARAARWLAFGKFVNAGQTCIAPDHLFVPAARKEEFLTLFRAEIARQCKGMAQIVSARHVGRLAALLSDARARGARLEGGACAGLRMEPALVEALTPEMALAAEEIFGPVLPVLTYASRGEVLDRINARPKPLALYVFERDGAWVEEVVKATSSGTVGVNLTLLQFSHPGLPFGGVNHSGIGAAHGEAGFRAFSHERAVLKNRCSPVPLLFPPHGGRARRLIALARRLLG